MLGWSEARACTFAGGQASSALETRHDVRGIRRSSAHTFSQWFLQSLSRFAFAQSRSRTRIRTSTHARCRSHLPRDTLRCVTSLSLRRVLLPRTSEIEQERTGKERRAWVPGSSDRHRANTRFLKFSSSQNDRTQTRHAPELPYAHPLPMQPGLSMWLSGPHPHPHPSRSQAPPAARVAMGSCDEVLHPARGLGLELVVVPASTPLPERRPPSHTTRDTRLAAPR